MIKKIISKALLAFAFAGCILGGYQIDAHAQNSYLDVTVSNISGVVSQDPNSLKTLKDDNEQTFYIRLTKLEHGPSISFTAYDNYGNVCSSELYYPASKVGSRIPHPYDVRTAYAKQKYYVHATTVPYYGGVHGVGTYCP